MDSLPGFKQKHILPILMRIVMDNGIALLNGRKRAKSFVKLNHLVLLAHVVRKNSLHCAGKPPNSVILFDAIRRIEGTDTLNIAFLQHGFAPIENPNTFYANSQPRIRQDQKRRRTQNAIKAPSIQRR